MRSRYAAFALGLGDYLVTTLASSHESLAEGRAELASALARAKESQRFLGLRIDEEREEGDEGEVLFLARVFSRGRDVSFAELSSFVREGGAWRYASGVTVDARGRRFEGVALTRARLLELAAEATGA